MIDIIFYTAITFFVILFIKNYFVYKNMKKYNKFIFSQEGWYLLEINSPEYESLLFNPTKWTYKQMFGSYINEADD